jgi:hypothetical protein
MSEQTKLPWRVVAAGCVVKMDGIGHGAEDDCIVDASGEEVIGTSEWLRGTPRMGSDGHQMCGGLR